MDIEMILKDIREEILREIKNKYNTEKAAVKKDVDTFIQESKEKISRWATLLRDGKLTTEEFTLLMHSQKDLFIMTTLHKAGVSGISLGHFKNRIIAIAINRILAALLLI